MQRYLAAAAIAAVCFTMADMRLAGAQGPSACPAPTLLKDVPSLRVREGDQATVTVTGHKKPKPSAVPSPTTLFVIPPNVTAVNATTSSGEHWTIIVPKDAPSASGYVISAIAPTLPPAASAVQTIAPTPPPNGTIGGPVDRLTADVKDPSVAAIATAVPTTAPNAGADDTPSVAYTIKGNHAGTTRMIVTQGNNCVAVDVLVRPPTNRFTLTTGVGTSSVPTNTFTSTTVTPAPVAASQSPAPGTYVSASERSGSQVSVPILGSFRVTDFPTQFNVFLTGGFFADSGRDKQVYGLSVGSSEFLLTFGTHSSRVDSLSTDVVRGMLTVPGAPITVSSRTMRPFYSLTFPLSTFTDILGKIK